VFDEPSPTAEQVDFDRDELLAQTTPEVSGRIDNDEDLGEEFAATDPNITLPSSDPSAVSGFDRLDPSSSGSDLFGDATVVDVNLLAEAGASAINLINPESGPEEEAESMSSIFSKPGIQPSDGGRVDLDSIPMIGTSGERTDVPGDRCRAGVQHLRRGGG
jgi:hypothetical protein